MSSFCWVYSDTFTSNNKQIIMKFSVMSRQHRNAHLPVKISTWITRHPTLVSPVLSTWRHITNALITGFSSSDDHFFLIPYAWNQLNAQINDREVAVAAANIMIELKVFYGGTARININYNFMLMHKLCVYLFLSPNILAYPHNSLKMWFVAVISTHLSPHPFHTIGIAYKFLWHVI